MSTRLFVMVGIAALSAATAQAAGAPSLTGQTWQLTKLGPVDRSSAGITALFTTGGKVSGFAGCNSYSGAYTTSGGSISVAESLAVTQKACRRLVMAQERAYLAALTGASSYAVAAGKLTLTSKRGVALATFAVQSSSLAGTRWKVVAYNNGKQAVVSVMASTPLTANFGKDGTVGGFGGCNEYSAPAKATPPKIAIGPVSATRKECASPEGVMEQEHAYLAALASAATYSLQGTSLELRTAVGALAVTLQRA